MTLSPFKKRLPQQDIETAEASAADFGIVGFEPVGGSVEPPIDLFLKRPKSDDLVFLKEKRNYLGAEEFRLHVALHRFLHAIGGPVAELLSIDGRPLLEGPEGRLAELQSCVPGSSVRPGDLRDAREMARCLAEFHKAARGFRKRSSHAEPRRLIDKTRFYLAMLEREVGPSNASTISRSFKNALTQMSNRHRAEEDSFWTKATMLHGDPAPSNFILRDCGRAIIIDLDDAHEGAPIEDLARLLAYTVGLRHFEVDGKQHKICSSWEKSTILAMAQSYAEEAHAEALPMSQLSPWLAIATICSALDIFLPTLRGEDLTERCHEVSTLIDALSDEDWMNS